MSELLIKPSKELSGNVKISGSKNSTLPILSACILTNGKNTINNVPNLSDINVMFEIMEKLGAKIDFNDNKVKIDTEKINGYLAPYELVSKMRGSFLLAGPLLSRMKKARISLPGGCPIGTRPVDLHLKGFANMGAKITTGHGYVEMTCDKLVGAKIYLDFPSVGATENLIMAGVLADGTTILENAAAEPEIVDLCDFLTKQGARIKGAGSDTIKIFGVNELQPIEHTVIPDRIEAGTFMTAFAMSGGKGVIENVIFDHIKPVAAKLNEIGVEVKKSKDNSIIVNSSKKLVSSDIKTLPFPGFPTDMQALFTSVLSTCEGTGIIVETVFENRFLHVSELNRMGASIRIDGRTSVVEGVKRLSGAKVHAFDLRAGAALTIAGMNAKGETRVTGTEHIERGYENFVEKLNSIGGNIELLQK